MCRATRHARAVGVKLACTLEGKANLECGLVRVY